MRREDGFTLVELLVAITIGLTTMTAGVTLLVGAQRNSDHAQRRTDATQRARVAMDVITKDLRSQTCLRSSTPPSAPMIAATATSVTFYMSFSESTTATQRRTIALDTSTGVLTERSWADPSGGGTSRLRTLGVDMGPGPDGALFTFYGFNASTGQADSPLTSPLSATALAAVARIRVDLRAFPRGARTSTTRLTTLSDDVFSRLVDPDGSPVPLCA